MSLRREDVIRVVYSTSSRAVRHVRGSTDQSGQPLKIFSLRAALVAIGMRYRGERAER
jgi:hypothetical protein